MLDIVIKILLIMLLILQMGAIVFMIIENIRRSKEDKKFWDKIHKDLENSTSAYLDSLNTTTTKGSDKSEQDQ